MWNLKQCLYAGTNETLVDPFLEMDAEQLERLETALQSEQAKQILGENVTAMLGKGELHVIVVSLIW